MSGRGTRRSARSHRLNQQCRLPMAPDWAGTTGQTVSTHPRNTAQGQGTLMITEPEWPYDTPRDDPLTDLRIPATSSHPGWRYLVAFDVGSEQRPTNHEALLMQSFLHEYIAHRYNGSYKAKLARRPYDVDGAANGVVFHKWAANDWGYRRARWSIGPTFVPGPAWYRQRFGGTRLPLAELMDHIHSLASGEISDRWVAWKSAYPELFGEHAAGATTLHDRRLQGKCGPSHSAPQPS